MSLTVRSTLQQDVPDFSSSASWSASWHEGPMVMTTARTEVVLKPQQGWKGMQLHRLHLWWL